MALNLTLDECIRVKASLDKATASEDHGALKDILASLKVADTTGRLKVISDSKVGHAIKGLMKYEGNSEVRAMAAEVKNMWAARAAASKKTAAKPEVKSEVKPEVKSEPVIQAAPTPEVKPDAASAVKAEGAPTSASAGSSSGAVPEPTKLARGGSISHVAWRPAGPTGDQTRDMVRAKLQEAFDKGKGDNERFLHEQETDTALMAEEAESRMHEVFGDVNKEYKARFRSLSFNLKDAKNPHFIRAIITGQVHVNDLASMEVRAMASEEMKMARSAEAEHRKMALMDDNAYKKYKGIKTEDGILKCPRCKSMKTEYTEVQTRSADEPTTKKCVCNACDYRWKFC